VISESDCVCEDCSDARLFCKNKQVNLKNKPKIGKLIEKEAQHALAEKLENSARILN